MMNKARGYLTARVDARSKTVMDTFSLDDKITLFPIGRLDKDTEGLLIITDDGALCQRLTSPESKIPKTYAFIALGEITDEQASEIERGVKIYANRDFITSRAKVSIECRKQYPTFLSFSPKRTKDLQKGSHHSLRYTAPLKLPKVKSIRCAV